MQIQPGESQIVWKAVLCCKVKSEIQQISKSSARFKSKKYKSVIELTWLQRDYWYYVVERQFDRKKILFVMPDERTDRLIYQSIGKTASRKNNEWVERIRCAYRRNAKIMSLWGWWWRYSISGLDDIFAWLTLEDWFVERHVRHCWKIWLNCGTHIQHRHSHAEWKRRPSDDSPTVHVDSTSS